MKKYSTTSVRKNGPPQDYCYFSEVQSYFDILLLIAAEYDLF
jgi:hypothetical protein